MHDQPQMTYHAGYANVFFSWDGVYGDPIQVCPGGYGEPVRYYVHTWQGTYSDPVTGEEYNFQPKVKATEHLAFFQNKCEGWLMEQLLHHPAPPDYLLPDNPSPEHPSSGQLPSDHPSPEDPPPPTGPIRE